MLRSFGEHSWPRSLADVQMNWGQLQLLMEGVIDSIVVQLVGNYYQIAVPCTYWHVMRMDWQGVDEAERQGKCQLHQEVQWVDCNGCPGPILGQFRLGLVFGRCVHVA